MPPQGYYAEQPPMPPPQGYYGPPPQQPIYVQQPAQAPSKNDSCLVACLGGMCLCYTLDMLF